MTYAVKATLIIVTTSSINSVLNIANMLASEQDEYCVGGRRKMTMTGRQ